MNDPRPTLEPATAAGPTRILVPPPIYPENHLNAAQWGMLSFLLSEVAFFGTLIVAYLAYLGKDRSGPTPADPGVLSLPLVIGTTLCLVLSSCTIHVADKAIRFGKLSSFLLWWSATILLGAVFLIGTGYEWYELIWHHGLTIGRNLFGTTFFTLIGFHAAHVTVGVLMMMIFLGLALKRQVTPHQHQGVELVSWYWHFVDGVWIVVFTVVYLIGR